MWILPPVRRSKRGVIVSQKSSNASSTQPESKTVEKSAKANLTEVIYRMTSNLIAGVLILLSLITVFALIYEGMFQRQTISKNMQGL